MPRLSNQSEDVRAYYGLGEENMAGCDDIPIDLCEYCWYQWEGCDRDDEIDHPPYEEQNPPYVCVDCGRELTAADNGWPEK